MSSQSSDVAIVGAGVIGAAVAWRCAQRGLTVTIVDPDPSRGAWRTAAGMLAPVTELHVTETPLLRLNLASLARWPAFADELSDASGIDVGLRRTGTVLAAWDAADLAGLRDLHAYASKLEIDAELLTGRELRALEPALASGLPGGLHAPGDHHVDPRSLRSALVAAGERAGVRTVIAEATALRRVTERVTGVEFADGSVLYADTVVLAAGAWSAAVGGAPVRPIKGQTLRLRLPEPTLERVVRGRVRGNPIYLVPRGDGRIVVGASSEEAGFDLAPRAGAVYELLRDAQALVPELGEAVLDEVCTGLRPGSPDNAPSIGVAEPGLVHATGHYRNGVLLTPLTADAVAAIMRGEDPPAEVADFGPARFDHVFAPADRFGAPRPVTRRENAIGSGVAR